MLFDSVVLADSYVPLRIPLDVVDLSAPGQERCKVPWSEYRVVTVLE
jgi:hypothetical protein